MSERISPSLAHSHRHRDDEGWSGRADFSPGRIATAIHEAGHVLLARLLGRRVLRVSIVPDGVTGGRTRLEALPLDVDLSRERYRALADREALIGMAGDLAVLKLMGRAWLRGPSDGDLALTRHAADHAGGTQGRVEAHLDRLAARAAMYIDLYRPAIRRMASALLHRRELTERQVEAVLRGGRPGSERGWDLRALGSEHPRDRRDEGPEFSGRHR